MLIFDILPNKSLVPIGILPLNKEKVLQAICEKNLELIFGLTLVKSEFTIGQFRIDTLAFDQRRNAFIIIEYKKDKNFSVIDQGYTYLSLMLNNKAEFILEYNENIRRPLKKEKVDWSQSRVIFVSPEFTNFQMASINFKDLPIELWLVKTFSNNTIMFEPIMTMDATESIATIARKNKTIEAVSKEIKVYTEDDHLNKATEDTVDLYQSLKEAIIGIGDAISINPVKFYIGFVTNNKKTFCDVEFLKHGLNLYLNLPKGKLDDPKKLARDVSEKGHWGSGDYKIKVSDLDNLDYIIGLIKQSYKYGLQRGGA